MLSMTCRSHMSAHSRDAPFIQQILSLEESRFQTKFSYQQQKEDGKTLFSGNRTQKETSYSWRPLFSDIKVQRAFWGLLFCSFEAYCFPNSNLLLQAFLLPINMKDITVKLKVIVNTVNVSTGNWLCMLLIFRTLVIIWDGILYILQI